LTVLPLKPEDKMPARIPIDGFSWANEAIEISIKRKSKILFFIIVCEADLKAVLNYEKRKGFNRLMQLW